MPSHSWQLARTYGFVSVVLLVNYISIAFIDANSHDAYCGFFYGSLFTHSALSAAWAVFGLGSVWRRLTLTLAWVLALQVPVLVNFTQYLQFSLALEVTFWLGALLFTQWVLIQLMLIPFTCTSIVHIPLQSNIVTKTSAMRNQLKMLHFLGLVTIAAVFMGIGRFVVKDSTQDRLIWTLVSEGIWAVGPTLVSIPMVLASLGRSSLLRRVTICMVFCITVTCIQVWTVKWFPVVTPDMATLVATNATSAALTFFVAAVLRIHGFRISATSS